MAAKKKSASTSKRPTPPSPKPAPKKSTGSSAGQKRMADEKSTKTGKRTDRAGSRGFGMTKSGVEARANSAYYEKGSEIYPQSYAPYNEKSKLTTFGAYAGTPKIGGKKVSSAMAYEEMTKAANRVRKKYGTKPVKNAQEQHSRMNPWSTPKKKKK